MKNICLISIFFFLLGCSQQEVFTSLAKKQFAHAEQAIKATALSHDGNLSITATPTSVCLWDNSLNKLQLPCLTGDASQYVEIVGISQNKQYFFTSNQVVVRLYETAQGQKLGEWHLADQIINDIAISANGETLLLGFRSGLAAIIDTQSQQLRSYKIHQLDINAVALSSDGKLAFTGSSDKNAILWQTTSGEKIHSLAHNSRVNHVSISDDGSHGLSLDAIETHVIWDLKRGTEKSTLDTHLRFFEFNAARFSQDNQFLLAGLPKRKIQLWRVNDGLKLAEWLSHQQAARASVLAVAFTDDSQIVTETSDGMLEHWQLPPNEIR